MLKQMLVQVDTLCLLENISNDSHDGVQAILDHNIVARIINLMKDINSKLKQRDYYRKGDDLATLKRLMLQCLYVLGNAACETYLARREILKYPIFEISSQLLSLPISEVDHDPYLINTCSWFLSNLTEKFDESQLDKVDQSEIISLIVTKMLYSSERDTYMNGLITINNLTDVRSEKGADMIVRCDESCNQQAGQLTSPSILARLFDLQRSNEHLRSSESDELILRTLSFYVNIFGSEDHNVKYFLNNEVMESIVSIMEWNSPQSPMHNMKIEFKILSIFNNLVQSVAFDFGRHLIDGGMQQILDRFALYLHHSKT